MPELPEVETIKLGLQKKIIGLKIKDVEVLNQGSFFGNSQDIVGKKIVDVFRRAKVLGIELENNKVILFHLKMSGQVIWLGTDKAESVRGGHPTKDIKGSFPNKSTRVVFYFSDPLRLRSKASDSKLFFNDQRKFGWVRVVEKSKIEDERFFKNLGPEPLQKKFTAKVLKHQISKRKNTPIKIALLDQEVLAGVGNIYASEACFIARIHPGRKVSDLNDNEIKRLYQGVVETLTSGIKYGGSSKTHYFNAEGGRGYFLDYAFVYDREGKECRICNLIIEKFTLGGRGTYFCRNCQK